MENEALTAADPKLGMQAYAGPSVDALLDESRRKAPPEEPQPELLLEAAWRERNAIRAGIDHKPAAPVGLLEQIVRSESEPSQHSGRQPVAVVEQPAPVEWERSLEPRTMIDAWKLSQSLHKSHMFNGYGSPEAVLSTLLLGRELGLPAMASLRSVHIIKGKHSLSAALMVALVLKSGLAEYFTLIETTDKICTYETKRKGSPKPTRLSYTIEEAEVAGLLAPPLPDKEPGPWHKIPTPMLRARCSSGLARIEYPDIMAGLYTPEELQDAKNGN